MEVCVHKFVYYNWLNRKLRMSQKRIPFLLPFSFLSLFSCVDEIETPRGDEISITINGLPIGRQMILPIMQIGMRYLGIYQFNGNYNVQPPIETLMGDDNGNNVNIEFNF